ncbi:UNVERIFIED_CONTAM: hypothetical protein K2H54_045889 [Gekko kuhli]
MEKMQVSASNKPSNYTFLTDTAAFCHAVQPLMASVEYQDSGGLSGKPQMGGDHSCLATAATLRCSWDFTASHVFPSLHSPYLRGSIHEFTYNRPLRTRRWYV